MSNEKIKTSALPSGTISEFIGNDYTGKTVKEAIAGTGWQRASKTLSESDVRTMSSANGGLGYKMIEAAGTNTIIQICNILIKFNHTGGTYPQSNFDLYSERGGIIADLNNQSGSPDSSYVYAILLTGQGYASYYIPNDNIFLYSHLEFSDYQGTAILVFDYRVINFTP